MEIWKDIPGWEKFYQVSIRGRVRSKDRVIYLRRPRGRKGTKKQKGIILAPIRMKNGYASVHLKAKPKGRSWLVHRLVLLTFVGPCPRGHQTRHMDGNRGNNFLWNLVWGTRSQNEADKKRHGTDIRAKGEAMGLSKLKESQIPKIRKLRNKVGCVELGKRFGVSNSVISNIWNRKAWKHVK